MTVLIHTSTMTYKTNASLAFIDQEIKSALASEAPFIKLLLVDKRVARINAFSIDSYVEEQLPGARHAGKYAEPVKIIKQARRAFDKPFDAEPDTKSFDEVFEETFDKSFDDAVNRATQNERGLY